MVRFHMRRRNPDQGARGMFVQTPYGRVKLRWQARIIEVPELSRSPSPKVCQPRSHASKSATPR